MAFQEPVVPDALPVERNGASYAGLRKIVDRQVQTLEAMFPDLMQAIDMRPVEHWCVWGALMELLGDDPVRVSEVFADYAERSQGISAEHARLLARSVHRATSKSHSLADGISLAGREAVRTGFDRCFLNAALYLRGSPADGR